MNRVLEALVCEVVDQTPILDMHTHLYLPSFGMTLWGIDELLTYHYLVAELMRFSEVTPEVFFALPQRAQADLVWDVLFVRNTPLSEAATGVLTVLAELGFDPDAKDLREPRAYFDHANFEEHLARVFDVAKVESLVTTNDPFDAREMPCWVKPRKDGRFHAALRLDALLNQWGDVLGPLRAGGFEVSADCGGRTIAELRRFLAEWIARMDPRYAAVSLPPTFAYPGPSSRIEILTRAVLPVCEEHGLPFAMMIGVRKRVNPRLGDAGDSVGTSDLGVVERLCADFPGNRFLVTLLALENQHALCVAARKFSNLLPFGCWWFMNNSSLVEQNTRMRLEMLGASFVPQHSDARVLEQLIYKWRHARRDIAHALTGRYEMLAGTGRGVVRHDVERDARLLLRDNAARWIGADVASGR